MEKIKANLPAANNCSISRIQSAVTAVAVDKSQILSIKAKSDSAQDSFEIARAIERIAPTVLRQYFDDTGSIVILRSASRPVTPAPSNAAVNAAMGGLVGLVIAVCIVLLFFKLDRRIRNEEDITSMIKYPILGIISRAE